MSYEFYQGYDHTIPTDVDQRIANACDLKLLGGKVILGVAVSTAAKESAHASLQSEINMKQKGKFEGNFLIGPYVLFGTGQDEPFAPYGLAVWELPEHQA